MQTADTAGRAPINARLADIFGVSARRSRRSKTKTVLVADMVFPRVRTPDGMKRGNCGTVPGTRTANSRITPRRIALSPTRAGQQKLRNQISALRRLWQIYLGIPNFAKLTGTRTPNRCLPFQVHCSSKMVVPAICVVPAIPAPPPEMSFFFRVVSGLPVRRPCGSDRL